jgi:acyl-CoA synthetase (AMP-forming)/AMP-acid ligase II
VTLDTFVDLLEMRASQRGSAPLYRHLRDGEADEDLLTYREAADRTRGMAQALRTTAAPGARVLLVFPSGNDFIVAFLGALYAGLIPVPVYPPNGRDLGPGLAHISRIVSDCGADLALSTRALAEMCAPEGGGPGALDDLTWVYTDEIDLPAPDGWTRPVIDGASVAFLQYTSGSTAAPKGVVLTHGGLMANLAAIDEALIGNARDFTVASWLPLYHDLGLIGCVLAPVFCEANLVFMSPQHFIQRPIRWLRMIDRYDAYISGAPNFAFELCARAIGESAKRQVDLSRWRVASNCSEPVRLETLQRFHDAFSSCGLTWEALCPAYGLAESTLLVSAARPGAGPVEAVDTKDGHHAASVSSGRAPSNVEVAIVDSATGTRTAGEGEVWVRGPSLARGYWGDAVRTQACFDQELDGQGGWLRTGDLGWLHGEELYISGRSKDLIILAGRKIHPHEVEDLVQATDRRFKRSSGVVFGSERDGTEHLVLVQEATPGSEPELRSLAGRAREAVQSHFGVALKTVIFVPHGTIPKTLNGKLRRAHCKDLFEKGELPKLTLFSAPTSEVIDG